MDRNCVSPLHSLEGTRTTCLLVTASAVLYLSVRAVCTALHGTKPLALKLQLSCQIRTQARISGERKGSMENMVDVRQSKDQKKKNLGFDFMGRGTGDANY